MPVECRILEPQSSNRLKTGSSHVWMVWLDVCAYVCGYICSFFTDLSGLTAHRKAKVVPYGTVVDNTLLKHVFRAVRFPARAWHHVLRSHGLDIMARAVDATVASPVYSIATVA